MDMVFRGSFSMNWREEYVNRDFLRDSIAPTSILKRTVSKLRSDLFLHREFFIFVIVPMFFKHRRKNANLNEVYISEFIWVELEIKLTKMNTILK